MIIPINTTLTIYTIITYDELEVNKEKSTLAEISDWGILFVN